MLLLGRSVSAATAFEWGLVNATASIEGLATEVDRLAAVIVFGENRSM
jgi:enoyl-CoA hydratase/carnithine racemase